MQYACSLLTLKSIDEEQRIVTGIATTPETDRTGDIVEPDGAQFKLPLPLLWMHDTTQPVGEVFAARVTSAGIEIQAKFASITEPGVLKNRLDEAWQSVKAKLVRGLSIGFKSLEEARIKDSYGYRYTKWLWLELSAVTIPANASANIQTVKSIVKSFDIDRPAASGHPANDVLPTPTKSGASDTNVVVRMTTKKDARPMKTTTEKIIAFKAEKDAKVARMNDLANAGDGSTMDASQQEEFDTLNTEVKSIDAQLARLDTLEQLNKANAKPVAGDTAENAQASRSHQVITVKDRLPQGIEFARYAMCLASAKGNTSQAYEIAKERYPDLLRVHQVLKAAVGAGTTTDANWAGSLVQYQDFTGDFIEYLRPQTIIGKFGQNGVPSLNRVPFNIRVAGQTTGGSGYRVGQGKPKPLTKFAFTTMTMTWAKVANIAVLTEEEVRFSSPSAEAKVRDALAGALIERLDRDFVDPTKAAVADVSPASITYGVAAIPASGTTAAALRTDLTALVAGFTAANISLTTGVLMMSLTTALQLSLMRTSLGVREFPDINRNGGTFEGWPVIVSEYLQSLGSPGTGMIILVNASDVYLADDGQVVIDASREASLEMLDGTLLQDGTVGTGASLVSLWQSNLLGLKAERFINWKLRRAAAVGYISNAAYVA